MITLLAALFGSVAFMIRLALILLSMVAGWKVFTKAGEEGWKSLIPVYNTFTLYKISWNTHNFWLYFGFSVVSSVIEAIGGEDPGFLMTILSVLVSILLIYYEIKVCIYLSKSFGMDTLFGILTFFLRFVGYLVIGFGNAYYTGPAGANDQGISL